MPGRVKEIHIRTDMGLEVSPVFYIGEIAPAFTGNHNLTACLGHLFKYGHGTCAAACGNLFRSAYGCHKSGGSSAYYNDVRTHNDLFGCKNTKNTALLQ